MVGFGNVWTFTGVRTSDPVSELRKKNGNSALMPIFSTYNELYFCSAFSRVFQQMHLGHQFHRLQGQSFEVNRLHKLAGSNAHGDFPRHTQQ